MSEAKPARLARSPEIEGRLRSMALLLSSLAEEAAEQGLDQVFQVLREARQALIAEARRYYGVEL
ncbi:hypothetical protein DFH01_02645 [Falsiroseomonas bella]|uniref:Uncharacterized protein n=1 Tax=Falsiroseomonas bella TaxID=2184016 RepID=A0A317FKU8_9PROT|nr:hypothetical protein [Falsiroseomonas bella]PWS38216.1 hypothetical protein DFH01_02645 [Falsiroseomonas bella]